MNADADEMKGRKGPSIGRSGGDEGWGDGDDRHEISNNDKDCDCAPSNKIPIDQDGACAPSSGIALIGASATYKTANADAGDDETVTGFSTTTVNVKPSSGVGDHTDNNTDIGICASPSSRPFRTMLPNEDYGAAIAAHNDCLVKHETNRAVSASLQTLPGAFRVTPRRSTDSALLVDAERGLLQQEREDPTAGEDDNIPHHVPSAYLVTEEDDKSVEIVQAEQVLPFFQRKEGQLTIVIVGGLLSALTLLLGGLLTRDNSASGSDVAQQELSSDVPSVAPSFDPRPTLAIVRDRGVVNCGVEDTSQDQEGGVNLGRFNIDSCRAISASVFGNPDKINLVIVGTYDRYERLVGREVDVLLAGDSYTVETAIREPTTGEPLGFGFPYYDAAVVYLGSETFVKCANDQKRYDECEQLSICAVDTPEIRSLITSFFPVTFISFGPFAEAEMSLKNETCNVLVADTYRIYGSNSGLQDDITEGKYVISDYHISRNLFSSVVRFDDGEWYDVVEASRMAAIRATQLGIRRNELQCPVNSTDDEIELSFVNAPLCVGNALEVFQEHLGQTVLSFNGPLGAYLSVIDAPNFGSLECENCEDVLNSGRLRTISERGYLNCAVYLDPLHNLTRSSLATLVNVKYCEIMAVAIFQGNADAVNITYIDEIDVSAAFPREFDYIAGASWEERVGFDTSNLGTMSSNLPYFFHDKLQYNGKVYDGLGLAISYTHDDADHSLSFLATVVSTATIYAQRKQISRATYFDMPLIHLLGDSLAFMLRDIVMYAGNYDDVINEALVLSDGSTEVGWNTVIQNVNMAPTTPVFYCDYTGNCPPCQWFGNVCVSLGPY
mmetsp:Transcript_33585/g.81202  ORF Transcript_33585/g.81202 Transcript_33585/m.81202 type:complete len:838 (+) Transcript_33585:85-2598(+)